ncbi:MAG: CapA family protein [Candidatus Electryonea clarkiae]|nr:CapA family protein [Candidatus Electryonea clarkiae]MDP8289168.1 CapA family protein [Candidatus Electryonea clarkiae]
MEFTILIGGDIQPGLRYIPLFRRGDAATIFGDLLKEFKDTEFSIVNLESPFIEKPTPILKAGSVFGIDSSCISGLLESGIDAVCLANNHIMDHGANGLRFTLETCNRNGLLNVGAGKDLSEASRLLIINIKGKRIAFLAMADHEFSIAGRNAWGVNPTDLISFVRTVKENHSNYDFLIVLLHEGVEYYSFPSPRLQKFCRFIVEEGANAVICQHSHCPGSYEFYKDVPIVYGQGDFISENCSHLADPRGFLTKLTLYDDNTQMEIIPYTQIPQEGVRRMHRTEKERFISDLEERNKLLYDPDLLEDAWQRYCEKQTNYYIALLRGYGRYFRKLNSIFHLERFSSSKQVTSLLHLVRCEAHREVMQTILEQLYHKKRAFQPENNAYNKT